MSDRSRFDDPTAEAGQFTESVGHFRSEKQLAQDHVIGRNRRVAELLCYLSLLRGHVPALGTAKVSCRAAWYQDYNATAGNQAAHYMPGQIVLSVPGAVNKDPSHFATSPDTQRAIGALFSAVQDLPANFNKADTYVEQFTRPGLKKILADTCWQVLAKSPQVPSKVGAAVRDAFDFWIRSSLQAYTAAVNRKIDIADLEKNPVPPGTVPELLPGGILEPHSFKPDRADFYERAKRKNRKGETTATIWDYDTQIRILGHYGRYTAGFELPPRIVQSVEACFKP